MVYCLSLSLSLSLSFYIRAEYNKQTVVLDNVDRWESITIGILVICFTFHMWAFLEYGHFLCMQWWYIARRFLSRKDLDRWYIHISITVYYNLSMILPLDSWYPYL